MSIFGEFCHFGHCFLRVCSHHAFNTIQMFELLFLTGSRCRVPFAHTWGEQSYHNAMVISVDVSDVGDSDEEEGEREPKVMSRNVKLF